MNNYEFWNNISFALFCSSGILFLVTVYMFFTFDIWDIFETKTGIAQKRARQNMEKQFQKAHESTDGLDDDTNIDETDDGSGESEAVQELSPEMRPADMQNMLSNAFNLIGDEDRPEAPPDREGAVPDTGAPPGQETDMPGSGELSGGKDVLPDTGIPAEANVSSDREAAVPEVGDTEWQEAPEERFGPLEEPTSGHGLPGDPDEGSPEDEDTTALFNTRVSLEDTDVLTKKSDRTFRITREIIICQSAEQQEAAPEEDTTDDLEAT